MISQTTHLQFEQVVNESLVCPSVMQHYRQVDIAIENY
jgi:hypothetical protein